METKTQQQKNDLIIKRDVFCCVSQEVSFILNCGTDTKETPFTFEDIENSYYAYEEAINNGMIDKDCTEDDYDPEPKEIYEWWKVSGWLLEKMAEKGEPVIRDFNLWGRTTTGQSIVLDSVITDIQQETEI